MATPRHRPRKLAPRPLLVAGALTAGLLGAGCNNDALGTPDDQVDLKHDDGIITNLFFDLKPPGIDSNPFGDLNPFPTPDIANPSGDLGGPADGGASDGDSSGGDGG